jgi:VanZ family protein
MTRKQKIFIGFIILVVAFIWFNSSMPVQQSRAQSGIVTQILNWTVSVLGGEGTLSVHLVRKIAHVIEYSFLGFVCTLFVVVFYSNIRWYHIWNTFSCVLTVAVIDESIQILSGRGPLISDVLLDMCSAIVASALVFAGNRLIKRSNPL